MWQRCVIYECTQARTHAHTRVKKFVGVSIKSAKLLVAKFSEANRLYQICSVNMID